MLAQAQLYLFPGGLYSDGVSKRRYHAAQDPESKLKPFTSLAIEEQDIKQGVRYDRCQCPMALAGKRKFPWARRIEVDHSEMRVHNRHDTTVYHLTGEASRFIYCFDEGASVLPCVLQMQEDYTY